MNLKAERSLLVSLALFGAIAGAAEAHSKLTSSSIAEGATIAASPEEITLTFNEPTRLATMRLTNAAGAVVPLGFSPSKTAASKQVQPLPKLANGVYRLSWTVLGSDGHAVQAGLNFTVKAAQTSHGGDHTAHAGTSATPDK